MNFLKTTLAGILTGAMSMILLAAEQPTLRIGYSDWPGWTAWEIAETLRRAVTPFFISMMVGMVMLALLGIEIPAFSGIINVLLAAGDLVLMFFLLMGIGEFAGKMKAAGQLKDPGFAEGKSDKSQIEIKGNF